MIYELSKDSIRETIAELAEDLVSGQSKVRDRDIYEYAEETELVSVAEYAEHLVERYADIDDYNTAKRIGNGFADTWTIALVVVARMIRKRLRNMIK